ncbi:MAG: phosphotransferase [Anaerolineae bacterium]|nr:phosphotransferase [Anaerolineae bacterium]
MTDEKHTIPPRDHKLGEGNTAEVFAWGEGRILKLWHSGYSRQASQHEAIVGRTIHQLGIPSPEVIELVQLEERYGIVYSYVPGVALKTWLLTVPQRLDTAARWLSRLHAQIHNHTADNTLPSHRGRTRDRIMAVSELSISDRERLMHILNALPDGYQVCHGDFHPDNVLVEGSHAIIIDWSDASAGPPEADVTRTLLLVEGADVPLKLRDAFNRAYIDEYQRQRALEVKLILRWYPILAAARLAENLERLPGERQRLQTIVNKVLLRHV